MAKTVTLYLLDGEDATRRVKCAISNWTGVVYRVPRKDLELCSGGGDDCSKHLKQSGIYLLFGKDPESGQKSVYVGQAVARANGKGLLDRIRESHYSIDWTEAVVFTRKDDSLGGTGINYLENRFYRLVLNTGRYKVLNGSTPNEGSVGEELKSELDEFIDYAKIVMCFLGHNTANSVSPYKPKESTTNMVEPQKTNMNGVLLFMEYGWHKASGKFTDEGFVLLKGSWINPIIKKSCLKCVVNARREHANKIEDNVLTSDIVLGSSTSAAGFVSGSSRNAKLCWHDSEGRTLRELEGEYGEGIYDQAPETDENDYDESRSRNGLSLSMVYKGYRAKGMLTDEGFVLLKGSGISPIMTDRCPERTRIERRAYADKIVDNRLIEDITFRGPRAAAVFVGGASLNGNTYWCDSNGRTLSQLDEEKECVGEIIYPNEDEKSEERNRNGQLLFMKYRWHKASGVLTNEGFVVLRGAWLNPRICRSCPRAVLRARKNYANRIRDNRLTSDVTLGSPGLAAAFISGSSRNAKTCWCDAEGRTLKELEKQQKSGE